MICEEIRNDLEYGVFIMFCCRWFVVSVSVLAGLGSVVFVVLCMCVGKVCSGAIGC